MDFGRLKLKYRNYKIYQAPQLASQLGSKQYEESTSLIISEA
jgi:hypothetical protein